jgi:hypothetical protein
MNPQWLNLIGLAISLAGAIWLACGLILSRKQALKIGVSRFAEESDEKNICLPHVRDELRESRFALIGVILLAAGFLLQIIASWLRF